MEMDVDGGSPSLPAAPEGDDASRALEEEPEANEPLSNTLRCWLDDEMEEAFLLRELPPATAGGRGRAAKPMRLDVGEEDTVLPLVDWDDAIVGQRAMMLTAEHEWSEAVISGTWRVAGGRLTHTLRLADGGGDVQQVLPDHRIILHVEVQKDNAEAPAATAETAATAATAASATAGEATATTASAAGATAAALDGVEGRAESATAMDVDGDSANPAAQDADAPATNEPGAAAAALPLYHSSLSLTGFRHVRAAPALDRSGAANRAAGTFECAFHVDGKEKIMGPFGSAREAADEYARFVHDGFARVAAAAERQAQAASNALAKEAAGRAKAEAKAAEVRKKNAPIEYDEKLVGRRVRALFVEDDGEWYDGTISVFEPSKSRTGKPKYTIQYDNVNGYEDLVEEVTLPDDTIKLLPVLPEGVAPPPLTKEDERRAYKAQSDIEEAAARAEIEEHKIHLHMSDTTNTVRARARTRHIRSRCATPLACVPAAGRRPPALGHHEPPSHTLHPDPRSPSSRLRRGTAASTRSSSSWA